jgi:hypothetical protein
MVKMFGLLLENAFHCPLNFLLENVGPFIVSFA